MSSRAYHRARQRRVLSALARARRERSGGGLSTRRLLPLGAALAAFATGWLLTPSEIGPTSAGGVTHWGGWPLETAFLLACAIAGIAAFRSLELTFRAGEARETSPLPLDPRVRVADRLSRLLREVFGAGVLSLIFLSPSLIAAPVTGLTTLAFLVVITAFSAGIAAGVNGAAGYVLIRPTSRLARSLDLKTGEVGGAIYHYAPAAAFGLALACALLTKLGFEEPLRALHGDGALRWTRAATVAVGVPAVLSVSVALYGIRQLLAHIDEMLGRFADAELYQQEAGPPYFRSTSARRTFFERLLPARTATLYRKDRLQLSRAHPALRVLTGGLAAILVFVRWSAPGFLSATGASWLIAGWILVIVRPFSRLSGLEPERWLERPSAIYAAQGEARIAARLAGSREAGVHALVAIVAVVLPFEPVGSLVGASIVAAAWIGACLGGTFEQPGSSLLGRAAPLLIAGALASSAWPLSAALFSLLALAATMATLLATSRQTSETPTRPDNSREMSS